MVKWRATHWCTAVANPVGQPIIQRATTIAKALGITMQANKVATIAAQLPSLQQRVSTAHKNAKQLMDTINQVLIECKKDTVTFHATTTDQAEKGVTSATFRLICIQPTTFIMPTLLNMWSMN